jgi:hypothetical protein
LARRKGYETSDNNIDDDIHVDDYDDNDDDDDDNNNNSVGNHAVLDNSNTEISVSNPASSVNI